jgi:hypothetical protein
MAETRTVLTTYVPPDEGDHYTVELEQQDSYWDDELEDWVNVGWLWSPTNTRFSREIAANRYAEETAANAKMRTRVVHVVTTEDEEPEGE